MPLAGISLGTGIGGGTTATISGSPAAAAGAGFNVGTLDTAVNLIVDYTSEEIGFIAYATDTDEIYIKNSTAINEWRRWTNNGSV
jgi:hypothetical protein